MDLIAKWQRIGRKVLHSFRIFSIREDRYRLPRNGREVPFYILESSDWVNVIPLTESGAVILICQIFDSGRKTSPWKSRAVSWSRG